MYSIKCQDIKKTEEKYSYVIYGITKEQLENNFEMYEGQIKNSIIEFLPNALKENKNGILDYLIFDNAANDNGLSSSTMEKIINDSTYINNSKKIFDDFGDELIIGIQNIINSKNIILN